MCVCVRSFVVAGFCGQWRGGLVSCMRITRDISQNISAKQHYPSPLSVCTVCVCVCVRARARALHIVILKPLLMSTLCGNFLKIADTIFHLDVLCVCYVCSAW